MAQPGGTLAECAHRKCYRLLIFFRRTLLAGLLVFAVASCGGDDSSNVADIVEDATSNTDSSNDFNDAYQSTGNDCVDAASAFGLAVGSLSVAMTGGDWDIETYRKNMDIARKTIGDSAKADFDTVADAYDRLAVVMDDIRDAGGLYTEEGAAIMAEAGTDFENGEVEAAIERVGTYYAVDCLEEYGN
jgi:hypothetical protein